MERLSEKEWSTETIGDAFSVSGTTTTHPSKLVANGSTPRITCASVNNGLDNCYGNEPTEQGGVLTVDSATVGTVLFQPSDFIATDHVEKIVAIKLLVKLKAYLSRLALMFQQQENINTGINFLRIVSNVRN
ncbi:MAG: restriction endonuclease subunit S [Scardovia wiggsiae]|uniref:restriction endonuclease subunit S n=1 Tax=Scardovia wiggsiae TaxID=230143 RepID=UPI001CB457F1|nr:restriction endonuclease subunit S [Scardovia wiggsiae]